jgi:hypothetical protein
MAFKDLFIVSDNKTPAKKEDDKHITKFPPSSSSQTSFPSSKPSGFPVMESSTSEAPPVPLMDVPLQCAPHMDSIMDLYEKGFANLNQPGVEFFEFFQAVVEAGTDNPSAYKMALKMLSTMDKTMSKTSLVSQSQFYINELSSVHSGYNSAGIQKKNELLGQKSEEEKSLNAELQNLREQMETIKLQINQKTNELSQIDGKYHPKIQDLECKIMANDSAKNRILGTIQKVVAGIKVNL